MSAEDRPVTATNTALTQEGAIYAAARQVTMILEMDGAWTQMNAKEAHVEVRKQLVSTK